MSLSTSTPQLLGETIEYSLDFLRAELRLFQAEVNERLAQFERGVVFFNIGAILAVGAVFILLGGLIDFAAASGMPRYVAALIVGIVVGAAGAILLGLAWSTIRAVVHEPIQAFVPLRKDDLATTERAER